MYDYCAPGGRWTWLVTGGCGQLGAHVLPLLRRRAPRGAGRGSVHAVCTGAHAGVCVSDEALDLLAPGAADELVRRVRPSRILHLAGITSPGVAERRGEAAWHLNGTVTAELSRYAAETEGWIGFASTDFVFDGFAPGLYRETDRAAPVNAYGRTKLAGEAAVLAGAGAVLRLSLLYGTNPNGRANTFSHQLASLAAGRTIDVVVDEVRTPLAYADAARALVWLGEMGHRGLLHLGGPDAVTPDRLLTALARDAGVVCRTRRISRTQLPCPRPRNVGLDSTRIRTLIPDLVVRPIPGLVPGPGNDARHAAREHGWA